MSLRASLRAATASALLGLFLLPGCDSSNPVSPAPPAQPGPNDHFQITLSAAPAELLAGSGSPATITVTVRRRDDGLAPPDGTEVTVNTDRGSLGVNDPSKTLADLELAGGAVQVTFFGGDEVGTANLLAQVGTSVGQLEVPVVDVLPTDFFLTGLFPDTGRPEGGDTLTITGAGFQQPLRVLIGGATASVSSVSSTAVEVVTPASAMPVPAGSSLRVDVSVSNRINEPDAPTDTLAGAFNYTRDAPATFFLIEVSPNRGDPAGGETVSIRGGGVRAPVTVDFGGATAVDPQVISDSEIRIVTPPSPQPVAPGEALPVDVRVTNALGSETSSTVVIPGGFTYALGGVESIVVTSIDPSSGSYLGGDTVTVLGRGFPDQVAVELAGVRQSGETVLSDTQLTFTTAGVSPAECPPGGELPQVGVTVTDVATGAQGSAALTFTYTLPAPRIDRVSPTAGPQLGNTPVAITGEGFEAPVRVHFTRDGRRFAATVQSVTETRVNASSPRVPDDFFDETDCFDPEGVQGKRYVPTTADVEVENLVTGCTDVFPNVFTYHPTFAQCRVVPVPAE